MKTRKEILREKAAALPDSPGVYLWKDASGTILYVGKAKNLRNRVMSYLRDEGDGRAQVPWLMANAHDLDYIVTGTEIEALVTEANMARSEKPRYNVRLKDDKRYPYIKITKEKIPRIYLTRKITNDGSRYIGPYTDVKAVRKTLKLVHTIFPIRLCSHKLPSNMIKRACLNYQIKRCSGPCVGYISVGDYNHYIEQAYKFLIGRNAELIDELKNRMQDAADDMQFELAAAIRDRIAAVGKVVERSRAFTTSRLSGDWDVVNFAIVNNEACVVVMEIREGNLLGKKDYMLSGVNYASPDQMLASFLSQYYLNATWIVPELHLPIEPEGAESIRAMMEERCDGPVAIYYPQRGEKKRLLDLAATNAETIITKAIEKRDRVKDAIPSVVLALKRDLKLQTAPRTIACIDISHLHGSDTVASLVFFRDGRPEKSGYRHFKIRTVEGIDDFMSMREVVDRYFSRRIEEEKPFPDLLMVDGGKGQLSSAKAVLDNLGLAKQQVAGLAKRLEEVFLPGASEAQNIPKSSSALHLLQRIRDEAHRFAITYQKKLRKKRTISTALTSIEGVGPAMAQSLLTRFGSLAAVRRASVDEIAGTPGIGRKRAEKIAEALNGDAR